MACGFPSRIIIGAVLDVLETHEKERYLIKMNVQQSRRLLQTTRVLLHSNNVLSIKESTTTFFFFIANTNLPYNLVH